MQQVLRLMNRPPETRLTPEVAREICERTSSSAVLEGSIAGLGSQYVLWLRARNCRTGDVLTEEQAQAGRKEEILNALSRISIQIRTRLGESLATVREHSTPLEQATTPSLEALKAYSAGRSAVYAHGGPAAIPHLQRAIAIDPQFAMAYGDLSIAYWNMGQTDVAAEYTRKAYEFRDRVSDRERRWILFLYDRQVTGNLPRELQNLESWVQMYPRDWSPYAVLAGWGTQGTGQYERGIQAAQEALRLNPDNSFSYVMAIHYLLLDRFAEAADILHRAAERKMEIPEFLITRYYLAFFKGDQAGMEREIARAPGEHVEDWMSHNQAMVLARSGRMRQARTDVGARGRIGAAGRQSRRSRASMRRRRPCAKRISGMRQRQKSALGQRSTCKRSRCGICRGVCAGALRRFCRIPKARRRPGETIPGGHACAIRVSSHAGARFPHSRIERRWTRSSDCNGAFPTISRCRAQHFLPSSEAFTPRMYAARRTWKHGRAERRLRNSKRFSIIAASFIADPIGALAHLQLARAYSLSGDNAKAKSAYEHFLTLWKDADADIPILKQAKAEYAKLQ